eukprot:TRINITY_DN16896_c0_g1_i1.p1 TRINITY_DN16896_c0_g1~~TRINITY_DN16896_c0_g1_i1.p1  ORF type:complete len:456 (+),score=123.40 TRINITY_DN16896_c0_g1_i1:53-1369(+)
MKVFDNVYKDEGTIMMSSEPKNLSQNSRNKYVSNSLEKAEQILIQGLKELKESQISLDNKKEEVINKRETKNEVKQVTTESLIFEKVVPPPIKKKRSMTSEIIRRSIRNNSKMNNKKLIEEEWDVIVFLEYGRPLKISKFKSTSTIKELMLSAARQHAYQYRHPPLKDLSFYSLFIADKDGNVDEKLPHLEMTEVISKYGTSYSLISKESSSSPVPSRGSSIPTQSPRKSETTKTGNQKMVCIKINFPDKSQSSFMMLANQRISDAIKKCCIKRGLESDRHHFESQNKETIPDETVLSTLEGTEINLVANSEIVGLDDYLSDQKAMAYEEFKVTKQRKGFGKNQTRIIGIDYDRISNNMAEKKITKKVKTPFWLMGDLFSVRQDHVNPSLFVLIFLQKEQNKIQKQQYREYIYQAENIKLAKKIVSKLSRILQMRNKK